MSSTGRSGDQVRSVCPRSASHAVVGESVPCSRSSPSHWLSLPPPPPEATVRSVALIVLDDGCRGAPRESVPAAAEACGWWPLERPASDRHRNRSVAPLAASYRSRISSRPSAKAISWSSTIISRGSSSPGGPRRLGGPKCGNPRSPERIIQSGVVVLDHARCKLGIDQAGDN